MVELWATMPKVLALILNVVKRKTWCSHLCTHSSMPLDVGNGEETYAGPRRPSLGVPDPGGSQWDTVRQRPRVPREITFPCLSLENRSSSAAYSFVYSFILGQFLALLMLSGRPGQATSAFPTWISNRLGTIQHFCMYVCMRTLLSVCAPVCVEPASPGLRFQNLTSTPDIFTQVQGTQVLMCVQQMLDQLSHLASLCLTGADQLDTGATSATEQVMGWVSDLLWRPPGRRNIETRS